MMNLRIQLGRQCPTVLAGGPSCSPPFSAWKEKLAALGSCVCVVRVRAACAECTCVCVCECVCARAPVHTLLNNNINVGKENS